jgi:cell division septum initiation protein DivIVA
MRWIGGSWNPATVSALAAIFGSLAGACASTVSAWIAQRYHERKDLLARTISHREQLYSDFTSESARAMADALQHTLEDPSRVTTVYALISRMRLSSPRNVVDSAETVARTILKTYSKPNLTAEEIQSGAETRDDPLREFSKICRSELESLQNDL